jgi:hypothetical protein
MLKLAAYVMSLLLAIGLSSCATPEPPRVQVPPAQLQDPPAPVMVPRRADFRDRLVQFFQAGPPSSSSPSPTRPTK